MNESASRTVQERLVLIAFAPLDAGFSGDPRAVRVAVAFFGIGLVLFVGAVVLERRRLNGP